MTERSGNASLRFFSSWLDREISVSLAIILIRQRPGVPTGGTVPAVRVFLRVFIGKQALFLP